MLTGKHLGLLKPLLMARKDAIEAYYQMIESNSFKRPIPYREVVTEDFKGIFLPGGHHKGVKEYLESDILQDIISDFFEQNKKIAAVCHGVLLTARSTGKNGRSVLYDYKTTSLLKSQELLAYYLTALWLGDYYLTYPETTVENEVLSYLHNSSQFYHGPIPVFRDSLGDTRHSFVVKDRNYVSARWPGDIYGLSLKFIEVLDKTN